MNLLLEEKLKMRPDGPTDHELSNMFFTTKHTWRPMYVKAATHIGDNHRHR